MRRRCQRNSVSGVTSHPARLGRGSAAAIAPSKVRSASVSSGRSIWRRSTASWWRNTMISRSFERPERTASRASDARNRYKIRYTRTQDRPASRQVNDHGRVHDTRRRKVRDLEVSGRRTTLVWLRRRFVCDNCGTRHLEDHPEFENKLTRRLSRRLVADARVMTLRAAARRHGLGWHLINGVVKAWAGCVAEHRRSRRCRVLVGR